MKLPFSFTMKFAFRLLLPGFILALGLSPCVQYVLNRLQVELDGTVTFFLSCVVLGWLFVLFDMQIYMLFEGRRYWPAAARALGLRLEQRRLQRWYRIARGSDRMRCMEASVELRRFPVDDENGDFSARFPTRLGNLIAAFEAYPERVYGMDSVFYWPRIWVTLEEDKRRETDDQQAIADSVLYATAALYLDALLCSGYAIYAQVYDTLTPWLPGSSTLAAMAVVCALAGFVLYRSSLHAHAAYGELFKSVFDQHRGNVEIAGVIAEICNIAPAAVPTCTSPKEEYKIAWRYLNNNYIKIGEQLLRPKEAANWSSALHEVNRADGQETS